MRYSSDCARWSQIGIVAGQMKPHSRPRLRLPYGFNRPARPRWRSKEELNAAVIIARVGWDDTFVADFAPIILIEKILDAGENTESPIPEFHFRGQVPNAVGGNGALESIIRVAEVIAHDCAEKGDLHYIFVAIDSARLELIVRSVGWNQAFIGSGSKLGVEQGDVAVDRQCAPRILSAAIDEPKNIEFAGGFKSEVTSVADIPCRREPIRQTDVAHLIIKREVEATDVEIYVRQRLAAKPELELKRFALF